MWTGVRRLRVEVVECLLALAACPSPRCIAWASERNPSRARSVLRFARDLQHAGLIKVLEPVTEVVEPSPSSVNDVTEILSSPSTGPSGWSGPYSFETCCLAQEFAVDDCWSGVFTFEAWCVEDWTFAGCWRGCGKGGELAFAGVSAAMCALGNDVRVFDIGDINGPEVNLYTQWSTGYFDMI